MRDNWDLIKVTHIILWIMGIVDKTSFCNSAIRVDPAGAAGKKAALSGNPGWIVKKILNNFGKKYLTK